MTVDYATAVDIPGSEAGCNQGQEGEDSEVAEAGNEGHQHTHPTPDQTPVPTTASKVAHDCIDADWSVQQAQPCMHVL